jgi:hypothetical protein
MRSTRHNYLFTHHVHEKKKGIISHVETKEKKKDINLMHKIKEGY